MNANERKQIIIMTSQFSATYEVRIYGEPFQGKERYSQKEPLLIYQYRDEYEGVSADNIAKRNRTDLLESLIQEKNSAYSTQNFIHDKDDINTQFSPSIIDNVAWLLMQTRIITETNSLKNTATASRRITKTIEVINQANQTTLADIIRMENETSKMSFWSRLFKFVTGIVQIISAAVVLATAGITGAGIAVAAYLLIQGANDLSNAVSGQQANWISEGISSIAQSLGASKDLADKIGMGVSIALALITTIATLGMSAGGIPGGIAGCGRLLGAPLKVVQSAASSACGIGQGVTGVITANIIKDVADLEAHMVDLEAAINLQQKSQKLLTQNSQNQMSSFESTMQNLTDFLLSITDTNKKFIQNIA